MSKLQRRAIAKFICDKFELTHEACNTDEDFLACQTGLYKCQYDLGSEYALKDFMTADETDEYMFSIDRGLEHAEEQIKQWRQELDRFHNSFYDNPAEFTKLIAKLGVEK